MESGSASQISRYLVISNISKINNVQSLIQSALAFNFTPILVKPKRMQDDWSSFGHVIVMEDFGAMLLFLKDRGIPLIGIEIGNNSTSVLDFSFPEEIALMPGNEGTGLSQKQRDAVDLYLYIPQYGFGTASLNVYIATTLVLHRYTAYQSRFASIARCIPTSAASADAPSAISPAAATAIHTMDILTAAEGLTRSDNVVV
jgi:tRNA G18 (ribose-2'-O)-methylase SpoU